jgi:hypothetical protein
MTSIVGSLNLLSFLYNTSNLLALSYTSPQDMTKVLTIDPLFHTLLPIPKILMIVSDFNNISSISLSHSLMFHAMDEMIEK